MVEKLLPKEQFQTGGSPMKVRDEIEKYANENDKECLLWLLTNYSLQSQFYFLTKCEFKQYGKLSFQVRRIWAPTKEGRCLFNHRDELI